MGRLSCLLVLLVAACTPTATGTPARGVLVSGPPPPRVVAEERTPPPSPDSAWVPGYWHWTGVTYAWIPGHWEAPPPGARWNAPTYAQTADGVRYEPGRWSTARANALR